MDEDPPTHCRLGHPFGPRLVHLTWLPCRCPGSRNGGHTVYMCEHVIDGTRCADEQIHGSEHVGPEPR